jgi:hypothetical protein
MTPAPDTLAAIERVREALLFWSGHPATGSADAQLADLDTLAAALARVERREPDYEVFYEWVAENAPRIIELCPYKFPHRYHLAPEAGSS